MTTNAFSKIASDETNEPQYVAVADSTKGHALVVYPVTGNTLNITDPTLPEEPIAKCFFRLIVFSTFAN